MSTTKKHDFGLAEAKRHNSEIERSPEWDEVRDAFVKKHPKCAVCNGVAELQVHHIFPFHYCIALGRPDLELDERNLIGLCETHETQHHLLIGHFDDFKSSNLNVVADCKKYHGMTATQIKADKNWLQAKKSKLKPLDDMTDDDKAAFKKLMNEKLPMLHRK